MSHDYRAALQGDKARLAAVDILERAAKLLREYAEAQLTSGDWVAAYHKETDEHWVHGLHGATVALCGEDHTTAEADARYIALMHGPVALALAVSMERVAWLGRLDPDLLARVGHDELVAVARAVLREPADG